MGSLSEHAATNSAPTPNSSSQTLETDILIIGAGPAGASLSCFLARYGLKGITISSASGTSPEPRAHMTNSAAFECLRDLDLTVYDECVRLGNAGDMIKNYRWCETMAGEEYARLSSWGAHGARRSDYEMASPCKYIDVPQSLLEPVLVKWSTTHGWRVRWDTKLIDFKEEQDSKSDRKIVARVVDQITGAEHQIRTRFLFGADGGRSVVARQLQLPFTSMPGGALACNVLVRADFGHLMPYREGNLHVSPGLDKDYTFICFTRMVKPWTEWYAYGDSACVNRLNTNTTPGCSHSYQRGLARPYRNIALRNGKMSCQILLATLVSTSRFSTYPTG